MITPQVDKINPSNCREKYIKSRYPDFYEYITSTYACDLKWTEKLYWFYNKINSSPKCPVCGAVTKFININKGYQKYCSNKCEHNDPLKKEKTKFTCLEKYGVDNVAKSTYSKEKTKQTCLIKYGVDNVSQLAGTKDAYKCTCLEKYGVSNPMQSKLVRDKLKITINAKYGVDYTFQNEQILNKIKQINLQKYGVANPMHREEIRNKLSDVISSADVQNKIKQTNLQRYGVENPSQLPKIQDKINTTKRLNHTFSTSKIEDMFDAYLNERGIQHVRQYKSTLYPFCCDFYLPTYDLYIEIQASWTHGGHPYDTERDAERLEYWRSKHARYYDTAIETWTRRDVKKRETAKLNNLNYLEIFSNDIVECIKQFEEYEHPGIQ